LRVKRHEQCRRRPTRHAQQIDHTASLLLKIWSDFDQPLATGKKLLCSIGREDTHITTLQCDTSRGLEALVTGKRRRPPAAAVVADAAGKGRAVRAAPRRRDWGGGVGRGGGADRKPLRRLYRRLDRRRRPCRVGRPPPAPAGAKTGGRVASRRHHGRQPGAPRPMGASGSPPGGRGPLPGRCGSSCPPRGRAGGSPGHVPDRGCWGTRRRPSSAPVWAPRRHRRWAGCAARDGSTRGHGGGGGRWRPGATWAGRYHGGAGGRCAKTGGWGAAPRV